MDDLEAGECSDDSIGDYTPLARPEVPRPTISPWGKPASRPAAKPLPLSDDSEASGASSDSDSEDEKPAIKRRGGVVDPDGAWGRHVKPAAVDGGGAAFRQMAEAFQADRAARGLPTRNIKKNNVWGSLIQEESLTEELGGVGVGRTLKDLNSDRGAETYDFTLHQADKKAEREKEFREKALAEATSLDDEMDSYWARSASPEDAEGNDGRGDSKYTDVRRYKNNQRRGSAGHLDEEMDSYWARRGSKDDDTEDAKHGGEERRGKKRNVRDRLGAKPRRDSPELLAEGVPHEIHDLEESVVKEGSDEELGAMIAARLKEPKEEIIHGVINDIGRDVALAIFNKTQLVEAEGGMMIKNGARRRTSGGVFLQLLRETDDPSVDKAKVKKFFNNQHNHEKRKMLNAKKKNKKNFEQEMDGFLKAKREMANKKTKSEMDVNEGSKEETMENENSDDEDLTPVNMFSLLSGSISKPKNDKPEDLEDVEPELQKFVEPEAPPNSVERSERQLNEYEDDFLKTTDESEAIELF